MSAQPFGPNAGPNTGPNNLARLRETSRDMRGQKIAEATEFASFFETLADAEKSARTLVRRTLLPPVQCSPVSIFVHNSIDFSYVFCCLPSIAHLIQTNSHKRTFLFCLVPRKIEMSPSGRAFGWG